ncbi:MAG: DUF1854 domain-containing protein [Ruminococcaceae bacterium]|nr:DUF1854 domain-containing protein [Oscillospiraceae bacterium]
MKDENIKNTAAEEEEIDLFKKRQSVQLTPENAEFIRSEGGLVSLKLKNDDGSVEFFERVLPIRSFPITDPDEFIAIREPDSKDKGKGDEIGMIRKLSDFDKAAQELLGEELQRRYFTPQLSKIYSVKDKFGYSYWEVQTSAGKISFVMNNPSSNIRTLEDGRVFIHDIDGNCFEITEPEKLDKASFRHIEIYM